MGAYIDPSIPLRLPAVTVKNSWPLRDIDHGASQEFLGQSDGPLGASATKVMAIEVVEGDDSDPGVARGAATGPRPRRLMVYFYDAWAVGVHPFGKTQPSFHLFLIVSIFEVPSLCSIIFFPGAPRH